MGHNKLGSAGLCRFCFLENGQELLHVLTIDLVNIVAVGSETLGRVLALAHLSHRVEGHEIGIIDQDQIIQLVMTGESGRFGSNPLLQTAVASDADDLMIKNGMARRIEARFRHFSGYRHADRIPDSLTERSCGGLNARGLPELGMAWCFAMQLAEVANII